jgi:imidazolonepropionase
LRGAKGPRRGRLLNELNIIADGSVLIRDGLIEEVGPTRRVENLAKARGANEINCAGKVVMPGFVDSHTHLIFPPPGIRDDDAAARGVRGSSCRRVQARAHVYLQAMARHGTTTVEAKSSGAPDEPLETKLLRALRGLRGLPLDVISTLYLPSPEPGDAVLKEFLPKMRRRGFADFVDAPSDATLQAAAALGFRRKVHADSSSPDSAAFLAVAHKAISVDHLENLTPEGVRAVGASDCIATLLPCAGLGESEPVAPARALIDAGAAIAIASNFNPLFTPSLNMQTVVALACMRLRMTPAEAITAATINGAHALGRAAVTGSIEPGKAADILILNVSDCRELSTQFGANLAYLTMKRGECIYEEGEVGPRKTGPLPWAS